MDESMTPATTFGGQGRSGILDQRQIEIAQLSQATRKAWAVLLRRFGNDGALANPQLDHLVARYVLGLSSAFYRAASARDHLAVFRHLLKCVIGAARTEAALRACPPEFPPPWTNETIDGVERLGRTEGLRMQSVNRDEQKEPAHRSLAIEAQQMEIDAHPSSTRFDPLSPQGADHV
ncbi:hypothetical protein [Bradyrhizobium brasilense]|uniref:hypothetical protein n=1 Tax=Bradyrhizobium brasilense TaxID=1419277 RepID=UPI00117750A2|nr:hypothetical protein [Bradyrhizobium brasilense]